MKDYIEEVGDVLQNGGDVIFYTVGSEHLKISAS